MHWELVRRGLDVTRVGLGQGRMKHQSSCSSVHPQKSATHGVLTFNPVESPPTGLEDTAKNYTQGVVHCFIQWTCQEPLAPRGNSRSELRNVKRVFSCLLSALKPE